METISIYNLNDISSTDGEFKLIENIDLGAYPTLQALMADLYTDIFEFQLSTDGLLVRRVISI